MDYDAPSLPSHLSIITYYYNSSSIGADNPASRITPASFPSENGGKRFHRRQTKFCDQNRFSPSFPPAYNYPCVRT